MTAPEVDTAPGGLGCNEHCDEIHPLDMHGEDVISPLIERLAELVHSRHDSFPWRLCSVDVCRDTAHALDLR